MSEHQFFISKEILYTGFKYPEYYVNFVSSPLPDLGPWEFQWSNVADARFLELQRRYPQRKLVPFAKRCDSDDLACFDASTTDQEPSVVLIHDFASPGWEYRGSLQSFSEWLEMAKEEAQEWLESGA